MGQTEDLMKQNQPSYRHRFQGVTIGMAMNNAANLINSLEDTKGLNEFEWAKSVCDCTEALLDEMAVRGLTEDRK